MDIGTGIFSGALVISIVALYIVTRDRWKWKRIALRIALTFCVLMGVVGAFVWAKNTYDDRIIEQNEFLSVRLQDTLADIKFKKGQPTEVHDGLWVFNNASNRAETAVVIRNERVKMVLYVADCSYCNNLYGLGIGSSYDSIIDKLGQPSYMSVSKDALERLISYEKPHLVFQMAKGKVVAFGIYNPALGRAAFSEEAGT